MKHNWKITAILLAMFVVTQFVGIYVVDHYSSVRVVDGVSINVDSPDLPFGMESPEVEDDSEYFSKILPSLFFAFVLAIAFLFILMKFDFSFILKLWFFGVVILSLSISLIAIFPNLNKITWIALLISLPFAFFKVFRRNLLVHNFTELLIYPGIAAVFVSILNIWSTIVILIIISIYDMWAVWQSGIMQKMTKYQMDKVGVLAGFFIPHYSKAVKNKIKKMSKKKLKNSKVKVNVAILGGGDIVFPIIASGVVLGTLGICPAICVIIGATLGLGLLFVFAEKKKFYPAMPFISAGIFLGMAIGWLLF